MEVKLLAEGGNMSPSPALSQKLGPVGINMGQVISKVNAATTDFKGLKVPVTLDIDAATKNFEVIVSSPPVSELIKKELGITKGAGNHKKENPGNASIEQIIKVAKEKLPNMLCKDLKAAVKSVAGTCVSLSVLIESKPAVEVCQEIEQGVYDKEIAAEATETPEEKRKELDEYFAQIKVKQDKVKKQDADAAAAAAEKAAKK